MSRVKPSSSLTESGAYRPRRHSGDEVAGTLLPAPVHQQVTEGAAAQPVAVDQFLRGPLSSVAGLAQILRGIPFQGASWCSSR
ncbi:hypothetical protein WP39_25650 [Streptomyces sp. 604F]|nr:hypothetical protein [Streptomyces sp. 604F]